LPVKVYKTRPGLKLCAKAKDSSGGIQPERTLVEEHITTNYNQQFFACRGAIKRRQDCAIKRGIMKPPAVFSLSPVKAAQNLALL
jgi:hypothetical protein